MKKSILVFLLFWSSLLLAQNNTKTITYNENEIIRNIHSFNSSTAITTYNNSKSEGHRYNVYAYDEFGRQLLHLSNLDFIPHQVFMSKNENIILINLGGESNEDLIKSINTFSGNENWIINANAYKYALSPDGKNLVSQAPAMFGEGGIQIINLDNGSIELLDLPFYKYSAEWLDDHKIVFINNEVRVDRKRESNKTEDKINKINLEINKLRDDVVDGLCSRSVYTEKVNELLLEKRQLESKKSNRNSSVNNKKKGRLSKKIKVIEKFSDLIIYNTQIKKIENQIRIRLEENDLYVPEYSSDIPNINIDGNNNIYISAYNKGRMILKYDNKLNFLSSYGIQKYSHLNKIIEKNKLLFRIITKNKKIMIIDEALNKVRELNEKDKYAEEIRTFNKKLENYYLSEGLFVDKNLRKVKFMLKEVNNEN